MGMFPVRVWRHFLQHNGFLIAAGVSYQALFSFFAGIYVAFAGVGLWALEPAARRLRLSPRAAELLKTIDLWIDIEALASGVTAEDHTCVGPR